MTENQKYLKESQEMIRKFETELEPASLREAYMALENVILEQEQDLSARVHLRTECLALWLEMVQLLDKFLDPDFNRDDVPRLHVEPPPIPGGVVLRPGADPALIDDPKARAGYEKTIAANRAKQQKYRLQIHLQRLNDQIPPRAEAFIRNSYDLTPSDREELKTAIEKEIKNPTRKEELLKLMTSP